MRRHATTILMLLAVLGLVAYLFLDREKVSTTEAKLRTKNVFPAWRKDDLKRIEIAHEDETIVLANDGGEWTLGAPVAGRVDGTAVDRLLGTLEFATRVRAADEAASPSPRAGTPGTERAHGKIVMGDLTFRFVLGGPSPRPEGSSYLRLDEGAPFVVSKELTEALLARADTYRDRTVVPYLAKDIRTLAVAGRFALERLDDRSFTVDGLLAARSAVEKVWNALAEVRAESFVDIPDVRRLVVAITPRDASKPAAELVFGDACPGKPADVVVVRTQPTRVAACVPKLALDVLGGLSAADLAERHPFFFHHDEIEELRLEPTATGKAIEVARRGSGFHLREPEDRELDGAEAEAMSELLRLIELGVAEAAPTKGAFTGAIARAKVRVGDVEEVVEVGALDLARRKALLHRLRDDAVLRVGLPVARRLLPRITTLHPLALAAPRPPVHAMTLRCGTAQDLIDDGKGLRLVSPPGYVTDGGVTVLVDAIVKGKALAWVADEDDGTFGIDGRCKVTLDELVVTLGAEGESGTYGRIEGQPGIFVVPPSFRPLAERIFVSHALLGPEPVTALSVGGRAVTPVDPRTNILADRVVSLGSSDVGTVDLTIDVKQGTSQRRVTCGVVGEHWRRCAVTGTKAVFDVSPSSLQVLGVPDAGK